PDPPRRRHWRFGETRPHRERGAGERRPPLPDRLERHAHRLLHEVPIVVGPTLDEPQAREELLVARGPVVQREAPEQRERRSLLVLAPLAVPRLDLRPGVRRPIEEVEAE